MSFVLFKNAVLALQIFCMMGMWLDRRKLAYVWTGGWISTAFFCSSVLLSLLIAASCFVFIKNAVLALQIFCMMDMWLDRQELAYAWTGGWASSAFLCSFVLLS